MEIGCRIIHRMILITAMSLALVAAGFVRPAPTAGDAVLHAYLLAGGSVAELCADTDGDGLPDHDDCPTCRLVAPATVPQVMPALRDADLVFVARVVAPRESRAVREVLDPARGTRGPPFA